MTGRVYDNVLPLASIEPNALGIIDYTPVEEITAECEAEDF